MSYLLDKRKQYNDSIDKLDAEFNANDKELISRKKNEEEWKNREKEINAAHENRIKNIPQSERNKYSDERQDKYAPKPDWLKN